jgi:hypothetical protein
VVNQRRTPTGVIGYHNTRDPDWPQGAALLGAFIAVQKQEMCRMRATPVSGVRSTNYAI